MSGSTTPSTYKVTLEQIEASIDKEYYYTADKGAALTGNVDPSLSLLTICILVLKNGFTIQGKSACADPASYDKVLGEKVARADAISQCWPLLGYELKTKLKQLDSKNPPSQNDMPAYMATSIVFAKPMTLGEWAELSEDPDLIGDQDPNKPGYLIESTDAPAIHPIPGYTGTVLWSTAENFEASWTAIGGTPTPGTGGTYLSRMIQEHKLLQEKTTKLRDFIMSTEFSALSMSDRMDLNEQASAMGTYLNTLSRRISRAQMLANMPVPVTPTTTPAI